MAAPFATDSPPGPPRPALSHAEMQRYDSKLKYLLYGGGEDRPETPVHGHGKKSVAHAAVVQAPFALSVDPAPQAAYPSDELVADEPEQSPILNLLASKKKEGAGKVCAPFDPEVYRAQRVANAANAAASKQKNWGSGGIFGSS